MHAATDSAGSRPPGPLGATTATGAPPLLALFRQRSFSALWWGQLVSLLGERFSYLGLVALLAEHTHGLRDAHSAWLLSAFANMMLAPVLIFAPFAGAWIDRWDLRRVVVTCDVLRAVIVLLVPVAYGLTGTIVPVFALLFLLFTCGVIFLPAKSALTPEVVPAPQLLAANTWLTAAGIAAAGVGALAGGWLVDHWGWARALYLNGATYLISAGTMLAISYRPHMRRPSGAAPGMRDYLRQLREGWSAMRDTAAVGFVLTALGTVWWCGGFLHVAGNLHVLRAASIPGMERMGTLMAVLGVGGGLSAWWINSAGKRVPRSWLMAGAIVPAGAGLLVFAVSTRFVLFAAAAFLIGLAAAPIILVGETMLQESTAPGMRGRVFAARDFLMRAVLLVSVSVAGWVTLHAGAPRALLLCAALTVAAGLLAMGSAWRASTIAPAPGPRADLLGPNACDVTRRRPRGPAPRSLGPVSGHMGRPARVRRGVLLAREDDGGGDAATLDLELAPAAPEPHTKGAV